MTIITCVLVAIFWPQILLFIGMICTGIVIVTIKLWELTCFLAYWAIYWTVSMGFILAVVLLTHKAFEFIGLT